jgi:TRAP-type C4-dicarboxylate transport system permease small subunit
MSQTATVPAGQGGFRAAYGKFLERLVIVLMVGLFGEVTAGVVFRTIGKPLVWYDEIASALLAWLTFYGSALASFKRGHIGCPEIIDMMPAELRRIFSIIAQLVVIAFFALVGWVGASILPILATDTMASVPSITMDILQSVIPISAVMILIAEFMTLSDLIRNKTQHSSH